MGQGEHSITREGTVAGVVGGALVALWYLIYDTASGQPLRTPTVLGEIIFRGDFAPAISQVVPEAVAGITAVHSSFSPSSGWVSLSSFICPHAIRPGGWACGSALSWGSPCSAASRSC